MTAPGDTHTRRGRLTRAQGGPSSLFFAQSRKNRAQLLVRPRSKPLSRQAAAFFEVALTTDTSADFTRRLACYRNSRGDDFYVVGRREGLLLPEDDSAFGQVVGGEFDLDAVAGEDADEVLAHLAGDDAEDFVSELSSLSLNMALGNAVATVASTSIGSDLATFPSFVNWNDQTDRPSYRIWPEVQPVGNQARSEKIMLCLLGYGGMIHFPLPEGWHQGQR